MMKKILVPLSALAMLALVACGGQTSSATSSAAPSSEPTSSSQEQVVTQISNKEALTAEWRLMDADRTVEVNLTPKTNITQAIADGTLVISSNKTDVVSVLGRQLHAVAVGTATITVTYKGVSDSVNVEVKAKLTNKEKYGIAHEGTLEDPLTNTDAIKVGLWAKDNGNTPEEMYVTGVVDSFYHAPGSRDDGAVSFYLKELVAGEGRFEVYKGYKADESALTDDDIWKGATIVAHGIITYYAAGSQAEFTASVIDSVTGEKPAAPIEINATVAEALAVGKALDDGDSTWDYYVVTGYVVRKTGSNYFLADTKTVEESVGEKDLYELFSVPSDDQGKLLNGAKVTVKAKLKNYHGQVENGTSMTITVVEPGEAWGIEYIEKKASEALTIAKALADGKTSAEYYKITGVILAITEEYSSYGNMSFTIADAADATETLTVFRIKVSAGKAAALTVGKTIVVGGNLQNYVKNDAHTYEVVNGVLFGIKGAEGKFVPIYGTKEAPLSVADLLGDDGTLCEQANEKFSAEQVVVKGVLISAVYSDSYETWTLVLADKKDSKETIKCTGVKAVEGIETVAGNDTVIVKHFLEYYGGNYSLYYTKTGDTRNYGDILERTKKGTSILAADESNEHSTITGLEASYENDKTASFTVTADEGYEIVSVEVYGKAVNPVEGTYTVKVAGDGKIKVTVKEEGAVVTSVTLSVDTLSQPSDAYTDKVEKTVDGVAISSENVGNYGNGLQYRVKDKKASNIYNTSATPTAIKSITVTQSSSKTYVAADKSFLTISAGAAAIAAPVDADAVTGAQATEGVWTVQFTEEQNFTFFSVGHHTKNSGAVYIASIVIDLY